MAYIAKRDFNTDTRDYVKGQVLPEDVAKKYPNFVKGGYKETLTEDVKTKPVIHKIEETKEEILTDNTSKVEIIEEINETDDKIELEEIGRELGYEVDRRKSVKNIKDTLKGLFGK